MALCYYCCTQNSHEVKHGSQQWFLQYGLLGNVFLNLETLDKILPVSINNTLLILNILYINKKNNDNTPKIILTWDSKFPTKYRLILRDCIIWWGLSRGNSIHSSLSLFVTKYD